MPGSLPGRPGIAAFAGLKFGGYVLAGRALKRLEPALETNAVKIAAIRTGLGILLGPAFVYGSSFALAQLSELSQLYPDPHAVLPGFFPYLAYLALAGVRVLLWALVLYIAWRGIGLKKSKLWLYSLGAAVWSSLLDVPGIALASIAPGKVPFC